jgi:hypothetical protein
VRETVNSESFQLKFTGTVQLKLNGWLSWSFLVYHHRDLSKVSKNAFKKERLK